MLIFSVSFQRSLCCGSGPRPGSTWWKCLLLSRHFAACPSEPMDRFWCCWPWPAPCDFLLLPSSEQVVALAISEALPLLPCSRRRSLISGCSPRGTWEWTWDWQQRLINSVKETFPRVYVSPHTLPPCGVHIN